MEFEFDADLWESTSDAAWVFASLPAAVADELDEGVTQKAGFGSIKVEVVVGDTTWSTSVFPDKARATYVLPVKRTVRQAEGLAIGDTVSILLRVVTS